MTPSAGIGPDWLTARIEDGTTVIIDGATGSELQARGVPMVQKGWSVLAQLEHPDILQQLHEDYLRAGAAAIITNTFAAGRHLLEPGGLGDRVAEAHRLAVEVAIRARDEVGEPAVVAGSISSYMADTNDRFWLDRLEQTYQEQVTLLVEAGVDVIALEMMEHPDLSGPAVRAAVESGLPVWLGLSARRSTDGQLSSRRSTSGLLTSYEPEDRDLRETVEALINEPVGAVFVMHTAVPEVSATIDLVGEYWDGPIGVYPESGYFIEPHWQFVDIIEPDALVGAAQGWVSQGVRILGGCCGLGADHIRALHEEFAT